MVNIVDFITFTNIETKGIIIYMVSVTFETLINLLVIAKQKAYIVFEKIKKILSNKRIRYLLIDFNWSISF